MSDVPADLGARTGRLADQLAAKNALTQPHWRQALHGVPRHLFVPGTAWACPDGDSEPHAVSRASDPGEWWDAVCGDTALVTQVDDGSGDVRSGDGLYTSSASAPSGVIDQLEWLDVQPGDRVLEIGTGTGWTAALLSWRAGEQNVTSIEIDPTMAAQAAVNINNAGYSPRLVTGDGAAGWPAAAPYDRVHSTCAVSRIPHEWVRQCRPGAMIITPLQLPFGDGHLARLHVLRHGGKAVGDFPSGSSYMMMRSHRWPSDTSEWVARGADEDSRTVTDTSPRVLASAAPGACLAISAWAPGIISRPGDDALWLLDAAGPGTSWACASYDHTDDGFEVQQCGPRRLWDKAIEAWFRWLEMGSPGRERFGFTVTPDGQQLWLDNPGNVVTPAR